MCDRKQILYTDTRTERWHMLIGGKLTKLYHSEVLEESWFTAVTIH
jgi:hypothetical protein